MKVLSLQIHVTKISTSVLTILERKTMISITWNLYRRVCNTPPTITYVLKQGIYVVTLSRLYKTIPVTYILQQTITATLQPYTKTFSKMTASSLMIPDINTKILFTWNCCRYVIKYSYYDHICTTSTDKFKTPQN